MGQTAHRRQHMRRIRAHLASCLEPAALPTYHTQLVQQALLRSLGQQALPKLCEHRVVKASVTELQPQQIFPIQSRTHALGSLPLGQVFHVLQQCHDR